MDDCNNRGIIFTTIGTCQADAKTKSVICKCTAQGWKGNKCETITCDDYKACTRNSIKILLIIRGM